MAQHFQVRYTDDIDGTDLGEAANTIAFAFEGKEYSIDLSDDNAQALREAVAPYIEAGHRVTGRNTKAARKTSAKTPSAETRAIREWAQANGYDVSDRGRIPADVMQAYHAAN
ncbi:Lsr2 family protein [Dietzia maris]|uniref:histone-like nucleoid-structuring protein Lsr2 n=1 Tax=Dietzia TaxID=37914 RepID=UPI0015FB61F1|nr:MULTISPECIES: Lsr2 family protein [unclassified Dietzia]MBB1018746.1 Lsr2 family protein [Dietzia sp. DQ11-71]MBB1052280.1 Lsr2 family protein [Dietzia sp. CW19]